MLPKVLKFPAERPIGQLFLRSAEGGEWAEFAPALGEVSIPSGQEVKLWIDANEHFDPPILSAIRPDGLSEFEWVSTSQATDTAIAHVGHLHGLKVLELWETPITDAGLTHIRGLRSLVCLDIGDTVITDAGLIKVADLPRLRELSLLATSVGGNALRHLRAADQLEYLDLMQTLVGDEAVAHLRFMTHLRHLRVYQTRMTRGGYEALRRALPKCEIRFDHPHQPNL